MKLKRCSCRHCRRMRCTLTGRSNRKVAVRHFRQQVRRRLRVGDYDNVPTSVSMAYNS